ncbi:Peptidoglycan/xylan/chitin deacetylase, PgdA/CDA1 family [Halanaeroarchaeum sp. HSR-CO]|uniref:polysaccharide deacetylase family protein n=1 Tax=Halanaeroarchaeum sp. HSR-CO TaxID=2866382 RepID=UPI00217DE31F|nr:polysaccharide deacetylase family protein [Halanaeroarchaeum sp. HSR-CO]UWG46378.1 Peptidoglycan/xylan/chitin deacetylase, PgdA/CDA1 family [Halanaeroarchaeum sp. HSR-CO]
MMKDVSDLRQREVETYFEVIAEKGQNDRLRTARAFHNLGEWTHDDYVRLADRLAAEGATSSFSFLGREAERFADTIAYLDDAGHEIVLHGHRHLACETIEYDLVRENLTRGYEAIEAAAGVTPEGFIAPRQTVNEATLRVVDELGLSWVLGRTDAEVPADLAFREPAHPYDLILLNEGADPKTAFERLSEQAENGAMMLFHPNMLEYYDALEEYWAWLAETGPSTVGTAFESGGVGLITDAMRPMRIE